MARDEKGKGLIGFARRSLRRAKFRANLIGSAMKVNNTISQSKQYLLNSPMTLFF